MYLDLHILVYSAPLLRHYSELLLHFFKFVALKIVVANRPRITSFLHVSVSLDVNLRTKEDAFSRDQSAEKEAPKEEAFNELWFGRSRTYWEIVFD